MFSLNVFRFALRGIATGVATLALGLFAAPAALAQVPTAWTNKCHGCHQTPPSGARRNAANAGGVIDEAIARSASPTFCCGMGAISLTTAEKNAITDYLETVFDTTPLPVSTPYNTAVAIGVSNYVTLNTNATQLTTIVTASNSGGSVTNVSGTTITFTPSANAGTGGVGFTYRARNAGDTVSTSTRQVSVTITKASQSINFGALADKTYGNSPFTVSASATSGLSVTFSSLTTSFCTVSGTTVTIVAGNGDCTIAANQAGGTNYNPAPQVTQTFFINKASQSITFGALADKTYGNSPFSISATASSGLTVAFTSNTTGVCTVSGTTVTIVAGGSCSITASQAGNGNYNAATPVTQGFTVNKASQTINFGALGGKTFGDSPFGVSATATSGLTVAFASQTTGICTVSGTTVTIVAAGGCTIAADQAGNGNYNPATQVQQSFTVAKANQTITFNQPPTKMYGDPAFNVTATATSGLTVTFTSSSPSVCTASGSLVTLRASGVCTLGANQAGNGNYNAAPQVLRSFAVQSMVTFDFNGDKRGDILFGHPDGSQVMWLMNGTTIVDSLVLLGPGNWNIIAAADFNADGKTDLLFRNSDGSHAMWLMNGTAVIGSAVLTGPGSATAVKTGDFNGDGRADILFRTSDGTHVLWLMDGTAVLSTAFLTGPGSAYPFQVADFNGDGKADILFRSSDGTHVLWLMNGTSVSSTTYLTGPGPTAAIQAADFNGDGKADILFRTSDGTHVMWLMNGGAVLSTAYLTGPGSAYANFAVDFDGDGRADLLFETADGTHVMWIMNGTTPTATGFLTGAGAASAVQSFDFNGDGKADIMFVTDDGQHVMWLMNGTQVLGSAFMTGPGQWGTVP